jgi:hypothetical protein
MRIVAAAVKVGDKLYTGIRHSVCIRDAIADGVPHVDRDMQGFVANDGKFYNRFQSGAIAFRAGQTGVRKQELTSEDVW